MSRDNKKIGQRIRQKRLEKDITLKELGKMVGVADSTILRYENGEISNAKLPVIESIANALGVNPAWLLLKSEDPTPYRVREKEVSRIPLLGEIAAGAPLLAEEHIEDYFNLDSSIDADFALRVRGDSMLGADIFPGDIVFLRKQPNLENGEIGAILIENEATLKKFYEKDGTVILQSENDKYQPIILTNGYIKILGKLVAVLSMRD